MKYHALVVNPFRYSGRLMNWLKHTAISIFNSIYPTADLIFIYPPDSKTWLAIGFAYSSDFDEAFRLFTNTSRSTVRGFKTLLLLADNLLGPFCF